MAYEPATTALRRELTAAGPGLADNADLLRSVLSGCGDCIKVLDLDGRLQFMSEGGKRVMEVEDFSALKGCPWPDFWTGDSNAEALQAVAMAKAGKTARFSGPTNTAKGNPRYWDVQVSPIFDEDGRPAHLLSISRDITEEWEARKRQDAAAERERFLTEELEHRVKNLFSIIIGIAQQTFSGINTEANLDAYTTRIMALSRAHDHLRLAGWKNASIKDIILSTLEYCSSGSGKLHVSGPDLLLASNQATSLSLAVNELATNSLKYGALSLPAGTVDVSWSFGDGRPGFEFAWRERGGPRVSKPTRRGFGTSVIEDFLANDFGGTVRLAFDPDGVTCVLTAPAEKLPVKP